MKKKPLTPQICTSLNNCEPPKPHCRDCSHAVFKGMCTIGNTTYRWEHSPQFGPLFGRTRFGECRWVPHTRHKVWDAFQAWHDKVFGGDK